MTSESGDGGRFTGTEESTDHDINGFHRLLFLSEGLVISNSNQLTADVVQNERELFWIRNFKSAAAEIKQPCSFALCTLQVFMKTVIHEPPLAPHLHEVRVLHDLQVVRDRHDFRFQQFRNVADREFAVSQRIHDFQAMGVTQRLETFCAEIRVKNFLCHEKSPLRNNI